MLKTRVITALALLPFVLGSVYFGGLVFLMAMTIALLIAGWEFYDMARRAGQQPMMLSGLVVIVLIQIDVFLHTNRLTEILVGAVVITLVIGLFRHSDKWLVGWAITWVGLLYAGLIGSYFFRVRDLPSGLGWTTLAMLITWATDSSAYLVGTRMGKHGFFTAISPKKTWEGAIGGWLGAAVTALVLGVFLDMPIIHRILFGLGVSIAATFGDLAESLIKRQTGVKDASNLFPGHGGLLDRIDSLLFAAVFAYYYLVLILQLSN